MTATTVNNYPLELAIELQTKLAFKLRQLEPRVWRLPSRLVAWRNARVLAHLSAGAELYRQSIVRALDGDAEFSDAAVLSIACYEICQERLSETAVHVLLDRFVRSGDALNDTFCCLSAEDFNRPAWHPLHRLTIANLLDLRVLELGAHGWDILASADPECGTLADACPPSKCTIDPKSPESATSGRC